MAITFRKEERLCSRRLIDQLYSDGHRLMAFPFSVQWMALRSPLPASPCQVMIVAPKRKFHHAVDRSRLRRLARECWRVRKPQLYAFLEERGISIVVSIVYVHNEIMTFNQLGHKMDKLVAALEKDIVEKQ